MFASKLRGLVFNLILNKKFQHLTQNGYIEKLEEVLINYFNKKIKVNISLGSDPKTPSMQKKIESAELKKTTESAIMEDNFVKELIDDFGAEVIASSIEPTKKKENNMSKGGMGNLMKQAQMMQANLKKLRMN